MPKPVLSSSSSVPLCLKSLTQLTSWENKIRTALRFILRDNRILALMVYRDLTIHVLDSVINSLSHDSAKSCVMVLNVIVIISKTDTRKSIACKYGFMFIHSVCLCVCVCVCVCLSVCLSLSLSLLLLSFLSTPLSSSPISLPLSCVSPLCLYVSPASLADESI